MPFFDFRCEKCGHEFTIRVSNAQKESVSCPECGHPEVKQLLSPFFTTGSRLGSGSPGSPNDCAGCGQAGSG